MDKLTKYRELIRTILTDLTVVPFAYGEIDISTVFDTEKDRYLVVNTGWKRNDRIYGPIAHLDLINGKIWIQRDGTQDGIPGLLLEAGVPKEDIVIAYRTPADRALMGFAVS
jgi:hypothetical protein